MQSNLLPIILLGSAFSSVLVSGQLVGCDAVSCPLAPIGEPSCTLSNTTYIQVGITNFTTSLSPAPLTWTLGIATLPDPNDSSLVTLIRDLYLGAPSDLDLGRETATQGCALSFDGIAAALNFPADSISSATTVGTCSDALGSQCAADLVSQAEAKITELLNTSTTPDDLCSVLADALRGSAPIACNMTRSGSWGTINSRAITGPSAPSPIQLGNCHPTTGQSYTLSHVDNYNISASSTSMDLVHFVDGITPVLSFFTKGATPAKASSTNPETHLSCLKMISAEHSTQGSNSVMQGGSAEIRLVKLFSVFMSTVCAVAYLLM